MAPGFRRESALTAVHPGWGPAPACNDGWSEWRNLVEIRSRAGSGKNSPAGVPAGPEFGRNRATDATGIILALGAGSALTPINFVANFMDPPQFGCPLW